MMYSITSGILFVLVLTPLCCRNSPINSENVREEVSNFNEMLKNATNMNISNSQRNELVGMLKMKFMDTVKGKEELVQKNEELIKNKEKLNQYVDTIKELSCARKFRHYMETFGIDFLVHGSQMLTSSRRLQETFKTIKNFVKKRATKILFCAYNLQELYKQYRPTAVAWLVESTNWTKKVEIEYRKIRRTSIIPEPHNEVNLSKPNLGKLIIEFQSSRNESNAVKLFKTQCESCYWSLLDLNDPKRRNEINKLATQISEKEKENLFQRFSKKDPQERLSIVETAFVKSLIDTGTYFVTNNGHHEACAEVFYFADESYISNWREQMEAKWPGMDYATQVNKFCSRFAGLYDRLSVTGIHAPPKLPGKECEPNCTDYYSFIRNLGVSHSLTEDYCFIGSIIGVF